MSRRLLDQVTSVKVKLGLLVAVSCTVASVVAAVGAAGSVPLWLTVPVTVGLALGVTQLLAVGMTSPLREMTTAARRMARGDYAGRVTATSGDEVGELARAFNRMAEDLAAVDRQRRELVANVSHELRTPLAALSAVLENLVDGVAAPDPVTLQAALGQAERLGALVTDLLDLARVDAGRAALDTARVHVGELLARVVGEPRVPGRDVGFQVEVVPEDLTVRADERRLHQLVANLLDNAVRHSPAGGSVEVQARATGAGWRLEVTDHGPGVPAADRDRVFERFGTLGASGGGGGTGLGLAIARWVSDLHGGAIHFVDPEPPATGARVRVDLPHEPRRPVPPPNRPQEPAMTISPAAAPPPPVASPPSTGTDAMFGGFWPEVGLAGSVRIVLGSLGVGLLAAVVLPSRSLGVGALLVLLAAGGVVLGSSVRRRSPFTLGCAALCTLLAATVAFRDAGWIVVLCLMAGGLVCLVGASHGRTVSGFVLASVAWPLAGLRGLPWLGRSARAVSGLGVSAAAVRTIVWSLLGVGVFGLLFSSADAVFARWAGTLVPHLELDSLVLRAFLAVAVGGMVLAAAYLALNPPYVDPRTGPVRPVARRFEWLAPVLLVDAVFAVFLVAQAAVVFGGHGYLRRTTGLTYADYVHQGFGQLTVATALTLLVVWAAARKAPRATPADRAWLRVSLGALGLLTLVVVASALHRMHVYQEAYGFTRLRLLVDVFEAWLGLVVLGVLAAGLTLRAGWLPRAGLLGGATLLLLLAVANPDAWIARHNLDRYAQTGKVDWAYLRGLSDDAAPEITRLPASVVGCALPTPPSRPDDWLAWNLGRHRAGSVEDSLQVGTTENCPG